MKPILASKLFACLAIAVWCVVTVVGVTGCGKEKAASTSVPVVTASKEHSSPDPKTQRARLLMQDQKHSELCLSVFNAFKKDVKIGMTSEQFAKAMGNVEWIKRENVIPILYVAGHVPLDLDTFSIPYVILLYPNSDKWSNYCIYFRISKPSGVSDEYGKAEEEYGRIGYDFLHGELKPSSVVLKEFSLSKEKDTTP